ncbi:MAG: hypothetical protein KDA85_08165 [Planctomycetaceae bacterium]|nr:hypothetical protein [Planctomycetaceae bacterium]
MHVAIAIMVIIEEIVGDIRNTTEVVAMSENRVATVIQDETAAITNMNHTVHSDRTRRRDVRKNRTVHVRSLAVPNPATCMVHLTVDRQGGGRSLAVVHGRR